MNNNVVSSALLFEACPEARHIHPRLPARVNKYAAGYDVWARPDVTTILPPNTTELIPTGICANQILLDYMAAHYCRLVMTSKSSSFPFSVLTTSFPFDYRGELYITVINDQMGNQEVELLDTRSRPLAQLILQRIDKLEPTLNWLESARPGGCQDDKQQHSSINPDRAAPVANDSSSNNTSRTLETPNMDDDSHLIALKSSLDQLVLPAGKLMLLDTSLKLNSQTSEELMINNQYLEITNYNPSGDLPIIIHRGIIDADYQGEIFLRVQNSTNHPIILCNRAVENGPEMIKYRLEGGREEKDNYNHHHKKKYEIINSHPEVEVIELNPAISHPIARITKRDNIWNMIPQVAAAVAAEPTTEARLDRSSGQMSKLIYQYC